MKMALSNRKSDAQRLQGCKIKMDDSGNILIKRIAKANVYVKSGDGENAVANEILKVAPLKWTELFFQMTTANKLFLPKLFQIDMYPGCRRSAWAGQAGEVVWYEEVPAKRGEGAEEGLPGPEEAGVPGDYEDENVSLAKIPIDYIAIFVFLRYTY